jgi:hypothetical protein
MSTETVVPNPAANQMERASRSVTGVRIRDVLQHSDRTYCSWRMTSKTQRRKVLLRVDMFCSEPIDARPKCPMGKFSRMQLRAADAKADAAIGAGR